jgi:hypothetical protein
MVLAMAFSLFSPIVRDCSPARLAPALSGALLAAALAWPPAACAAASDAPRAGADPAPQERVLDVTLVSPGTAARPEAARQPGRSPALAAGAAGRRGGPGSGPLGWRGWLAATMAAAAGVAAWRRRPRRCASCRTAMRRLDREEAFAELDMAERTEHLVGDVRYEVWRCAACGAVEKRGKARDLSGAQARAVAAPVGSAAFLRRRARAGLSIWSPPSPPPAPGVWPGIAAASPGAQAARARDAVGTGDRPDTTGRPRPADG